MCDTLTVKGIASGLFLLLFGACLMTARPVVGDELVPGNLWREPYPVLSDGDKVFMAFQMSAYRYEPDATIDGIPTGLVDSVEFSNTVEATIYRNMKEMGYTNGLNPLVRINWDRYANIALEDDEGLQWLPLVFSNGAWQSENAFDDPFTLYFVGSALNPLMQFPLTTNYASVDVANMLSIMDDGQEPANSVSLYAAFDTLGGPTLDYLLTPDWPQFSRIVSLAATEDLDTYKQAYSLTTFPDRDEAFAKFPDDYRQEMMALTEPENLQLVAEMRGESRILDLVLPANGALTAENLIMWQFVKEDGEWYMGPYFVDPESDTPEASNMGTLFGANPNFLQWMADLVRSGAPAVSFSSETATLAEGMRDASIAVHLRWPAPNGCTVGYTVTPSLNGPATEGADFMILSPGYENGQGTLEFAPGEKNASIRVRVPFDQVGDPGEIFHITLTHASSGVRISEPASIEVEIDEHATPPLAYFPYSDSQAANGTTGFDVPVALSWPWTNNVRVFFQVQGEAFLGASYEYAYDEGTGREYPVLDFAPGDMDGEVVLDIIADMVEGDERVDVKLIAADPGTIGKRNWHSVHIVEGE